MPIVEATNTADRIEEALLLNDGTMASQTWVHEMQAFGGRVDAALGAIQTWAKQNPASKSANASLGLAAVSQAWLCTDVEALELDNCK